MSNIHSIAALIALSLAAGAGVSGMASAHGTQSGLQEDPPAPYHCDIRTEIDGNRMILETVVASNQHTVGTYRFKLSGGSNGNRANISQGGMFSAEADEETVIGRMVLGTSGANYTASLEIDSELGTLSCDKHIG